MQRNLQRQITELADTRKLAEAIAALIQAPMTIALNGDLGTGKTQFVRFFAAAWGVPPGDVTSPTYVLLQRYASPVPIYHCDVYRLDSAAAVWDLGLDELVEQPVIVVIEWADKFPECLPADYLEIRLSSTQDERLAEILGHGPQAEDLVRKLAQLPP